MQRLVWCGSLLIRHALTCQTNQFLLEFGLCLLCHRLRFNVEQIVTFKMGNVRGDLAELLKDVYLELFAMNCGNRPSREILYERCSTDGYIKEPESGVHSTSRNPHDARDGSSPFLKRQLYDRKQGFMVWKRLHRANTLDEVSHLPLSHIHLVFFDLIYELDGTTFTDIRWSPLIGLDTIKSMNSFLQQHFGTHIPFLVPSGSKAENVDLCLTIVEKQNNDLLPVNSEIIRNSDLDLMVVLPGYNVAFDNDEKSKIAAVVETENCRPGYLKLVAVPNSSSTFENVPSIYYRGLNGKMYVTANVFRYLPKTFDGIFDLFNCFEQFQLYNRVSCAFKISKKYTQGPSFNIQSATRLNSVYDSKRGGGIYLQNEFDIVLVFKCLTWPCVAGEWIHRKRQSGWPSQRTIEAIVSEGCHVVASAHDFSHDKDLEFRFSFSLAEIALFSQMSQNQKQCYVTFKATVTKCPYFLAQQNKNDNEKLKSYQLKTIFLWACESIPKDEWTTPSGLTRCFLFLIDQLLICLRTKSLPGYFIPEYNLFDTLPKEQLEYFANVVHVIRLNLMKYAIQFLSTMFLYRDSMFLEQLDAYLKPIPAGTKNIDKVAFIKELTFLQKLLISFDRNVIPNFWRKSSILRSAHVCKLVQIEHKICNSFVQIRI